MILLFGIPASARVIEGRTPDDGALLLGRVLGFAVGGRGASSLYRTMKPSRVIA